MKSQTYLSILSAICAALFSSCASGPQHSELKKSAALVPHNDKAMVLIYRTPGLMGAMQFYIWANSTRLGQLGRGAFYSYEATPGPVTLEYGSYNHDRSAGEAIAQTAVSGGWLAIGDKMLGDKRKLAITVFPNQTYYILMDGKRLKQVPKEEAEKDIEECHWLNQPGR